LIAVTTEIEAVHGKYPGGRVAIMGLGKLGSAELTAGSDVDLILLYDYDSEAMESDGPKPIDSNRYFTRLTQRMIAALSAPTAQGVLYEVDMRLRPSGNKGPVATRINAFEKYQSEEAWTWEHMALSRARMVAGDESLRSEAERIIERVLGKAGDRRKIIKDVAEMRAMIEKEKPPKGIWDVKLIQGGLVDIEFIAQCLTLVAPCDGIIAEGRSANTDATLRHLGPHFLDAPDLYTVIGALRLYTDLSQVVRLCIDGIFDPAEAPEGLKELICRITELPDLKVLEGELRRYSQEVRAIFRKIVK